MKAVIQRVSSASVKVDGEVVGSCGMGYMILFGAAQGDTEADADIMARKVAALRIFRDSDDKMNLSIKDIDGEILAISQFTLCADVKKGNRPSFIGAMEPIEAERLYKYFCNKLREEGIKKVDEGVFGGDMSVSLINEGPVTILYDTEIWRKNGN
jgi:D-tyrosyl-tRNA(Tyr) deacylase